jgi:hypothetical protein
MQKKKVHIIKKWTGNYRQVVAIDQDCMIEVVFDKRYQ